MKMRHSTLASRENYVNCIFCNDRKAVYYCEDCNLCFCEDCAHSNKRTVYVCVQCQSNIIECRQGNSVNGELYICRECGSLDIEAKLLIQRSCPSCIGSRQTKGPVSSCFAWRRRCWSFCRSRPPPRSGSINSPSDIGAMWG